MTKDIDLLCLANSRREGGRCIAGIDLKSGRWIRPIKPDRSPFYSSEISFSDGELLKALDKIKIRVLRPEASHYHPEDWVVDPQFHWEKIGFCTLEDISQYVNATDPFLFEDDSDRLPAGYLENHPLSKSLTLVCANSIIFRKTWGWGQRQRPQIRALFQYRKCEYNLVVTDDAWEDIFLTRGGPYEALGDYTFNGKFYLTIGMGERYNNYHYKLVISVNKPIYYSDPAKDFAKNKNIRLFDRQKTMNLLQSTLNEDFLVNEIKERQLTIAIGNTDDTFNDVISEYLKEVFENKYDLNVRSFYYGEELLEQAENGAVDIFILCLNNIWFRFRSNYPPQERMENSLQFINQIKTTYGRPVIVLSGIKDEEGPSIVARAKIVGDFFFPLPFEIDAFKQAIEKVLEH